MTDLLPDHIVLGITGGIAAYKSGDLVRLLVRKGVKVRVVMTSAAREFISPLTLQALSGQPVYTHLFATHDPGGMDHIDLARWADALLITPATANFMARLACGLADDLLSTLCLASSKPVFLAPAMNRTMWHNPATQVNRELLISRGYVLFGPAYGEQVCGDIGAGRMLESEELIALLHAHCTPQSLSGTRVLVTAGPTREPVDAVRVLTNRSSGKMGFAIAEAAFAAGADVILVSGPVCLSTAFGIRRIDVGTAEEMLEAVQQEAAEADIFIATAAVADYRPRNPGQRKLKKSNDPMVLELERTPDILVQIASRVDRPFCVGFAAETDHLQEYAQAKLIGKRLDMICANRIGSGIGLEQEDNALEVFWTDGQHSLPRKSKIQLAHELISLISDRYYLKQGKKYDKSRQPQNKTEDT